MIVEALELNQANMITFVMVNATGQEVAALGAGFSLFVSKAGAAFNPGGGAKAEIGNGWYSYVAPAAECDTVGPLSIYVTGAGAVQQNLEYVVRERSINAIAFTYTLTDSVTLNPIEGAEVWITSDLAGLFIVWSGTTDAAGVARDSYGDLPSLDPGTWYFFRRKNGYSFQNPDTEIVG